MSLHRDTRGSLYVEMIFFVPVAALLWTLLNFAYDAKKAAVHAQRDARECAWQYAMSGCRGDVQDACADTSPARIDDGALRAAGGGSFDRVASMVPSTADDLENLHGRWFGLSAERDVRRPAVLGGNTTATGRFAIACADDPEQPWELPALFDVICDLYSEWCP